MTAGASATRSRRLPEATAFAVRTGLVFGAAGALLAACSGSATGPPGTGRAIGAAELARGAGHRCVVGDPSAARVAWVDARNPIVSAPAAAVKDEAVVWSGGRWHLLASEVVDDPPAAGGVRWSIASATSPDLVHWSALSPLPAQPGLAGVASPDIVRGPSGDYIVTYQSDPGSTGASHTEARLFYRTSTDLRSWSGPHPLASALAPAPQDRMIDAALVFTGHGLLLGFKFSSPTQPQVFELARSTSGSPAGPWELVGRPDITLYGDTVENYEFVSIGGRWRLLATSNTLDQPWLFTLGGDPNAATGWLHWIDGYQLDVPSEPFNSGPGVSSVGFEHANSAFLCDAGDGARPVTYLFYAGSRELTEFGGWGHAAIGVARSTDLVHWQVPPGGGP